jgi:hypothetical protein
MIHFVCVFNGTKSCYQCIKNVLFCFRLLKKGIEAYQSLLDEAEGLHLSEYVAK